LLNKNNKCLEFISSGEMAEWSKAIDC
jgi:hypothetical protein